MPSKSGLLTTLGYKFGKQPAIYALEGSIAVTGALVQWLRDNLDLIDDAAETETLAASVEDSGGCYFVPAFSGLFAPYWRSDARGVIVGLTRYINRAHIVRATLESIAYQTRDLVDAMRADGANAPQALRIGGVESVVPREKLRDEAMALAEKIASKSPKAIRLGKWSLNGIELLDIRFKRINYNESVRPKIYDRMISERRQIAERFLSEGNGEAARIRGNRVRDLNKIQSEAYRQVEEIRGVADAKATEIYAKAYNQSPEAVAFYEFTRTMQSYKSIIAENTTLVLSTDSDLFKYLKGMTPDGDVVPAIRSGNN